MGIRHLDHGPNEPCAICEADQREQAKRELAKRLHPSNPVWDVVLRKALREARPSDELEVWL